MDVPAEAIRRLMEIGIASAGAGLATDALTIFEGIEAVRPGSEGPAVGVAILQMNSGAHEAAVKTLREEALVKNPTSVEVKMLLAVALKLAGHGAECERVIKELAASGDGLAQRLAKNLATP
jgi:Flp pilus assembly protein TadD